MELFRVNYDDQVWHQAAQAFLKYRSILANLIPRAQIEHIGSTAVYGALTKGDLDILVLLSTAEELGMADAILARHFGRNNDSDKNAEFSSFKDDSLVPPLGIQATLDGSSYCRSLKFCEQLRASPKLLQEFNDLKRRFDGKPMEEYRAAKGEFIQRALRGEIEA